MAGRTLEAGLHLLDRQLIDKNGKLAGKVDDLELTFPDGGGPPVVRRSWPAPVRSAAESPAGSAPGWRRPPTACGRGMSGGPLVSHLGS
jgi:hypothetical protein